jgi:NAD(P) transhydrogenase subunit alpha
VGPATSLFLASAPPGGDAVALNLIGLFTVLILAVFVGIAIISKVPPTLHTPLMSATNAIHGVILVGAMIVLGLARTPVEIAIGVAAVVFAALNVFGGFVVTDRMLEMFKAKPRRKP